jgi:hypothetical protein
LNKKKKKPAKAPASCADNKDKHDCKKLGSEEGECAWCEAGYMPASCMSAMAAKYLPEMVAKCKLPEDDEVRWLCKVRQRRRTVCWCCLRVLLCSEWMTRSTRCNSRDEGLHSVKATAAPFLLMLKSNVLICAADDC